jgi:hypothetical protein
MGREPGQEPGQEKKTKTKTQPKLNHAEKQNKKLTQH